MVIFLCLCLVSHKPLLLHDGQEINFSRNFHLFFPIWDMKDFEKFSLLMQFQISPSPLAPYNFSSLCLMLTNLVSDLSTGLV